MFVSDYFQHSFHSHSRPFLYSIIIIFIRSYVYDFMVSPRYSSSNHWRFSPIPLGFYSALLVLHNQGSIYGLFFNQGSIYGCDSNQGSKYGFFSNVESNRYFSIYCSSIPLRPYLVITHNGLKVRSLFYSSLINS